MKILILGAGAVGLPLAAKLSGVAEVVAVTRKQYATAISAQGLSLSGAWGTGTARFACASEAPQEEDFDYILITSKSYDTDGLCRQYAGLIRDHEVVSLQNGIGNEETIARYTDSVIGGVVMTGFIRLGDHEIRVTANAGSTKLGRFPAGLDAAVKGLAGVMARAGIPVETSDCIRGHLWSKNMINCSLNPLSAIMEVPYGNLREPCSWQIIEQIVAEIYAVTRAEGVNLPWGDPDGFLGYLHGALIPLMAGHSSSMLQDILHGHRTEIDFLNGAVVTTGARLGIATPFNACIANLIRFKEVTSGKTPGSVSDF